MRPISTLLVFLIFAIMLASPALATQQHKKYTVYDNQRRIVEYWEERGDTITIYSKERIVKGFIKKGGREDTIYSPERKVEGYMVDRDGTITIYDKNRAVQGYIKKGPSYDTRYDKTWKSEGFIYKGK